MTDKDISAFELSPEAIACSDFFQCGNYSYLCQKCGQTHPFLSPSQITSTGFATLRNAMIRSIKPPNKVNIFTVDPFFKKDQFISRKRVKKDEEQSD